MRKPWVWVVPFLFFFALVFTFARIQSNYSASAVVSELRSNRVDAIAPAESKKLYPAGKLDGVNESYFFAFIRWNDKGS